MVWQNCAGLLDGGGTFKANLDVLIEAGHSRENDASYHFIVFILHLNKAFRQIRFDH